MYHFLIGKLLPRQYYTWSPYIHPERQEDVFPIPLPGQVEIIATAVVQGEDCIPTDKMAEGLPCSTTGCGYTTTTQVPDDTDPALKFRLLQIHMLAAHNTGTLSITTDDAVEQVEVERHEHGDGTVTAPRDSCSSRSKKSRKRTKSQKPAVSSTGEIATMLC